MAKKVKFSHFSSVAGSKSNITNIRLKTHIIQLIGALASEMCTMTDSRYAVFRQFLPNYLDVSILILLLMENVKI